MEETVARHRKEIRDLQSQITQKKKAANKKTRKSVNEECTRLEQELQSRQKQELAQLEGNPNADSALAPENEEAPDEDVLDAILAETSLDDQPKNLNASGSTVNSRAASDIDSSEQQRKPNRQKARLARRAAEQEAVAASASEEAASMPDLKQKERTRMVESFSKLGLIEKEVAANGHCLYSAVADQMRQLGLSPLPRKSQDNVASQEDGASNAIQAVDYKAVRNVAASYISRNPDNFLPFLEEPLESYVYKIRETGEWGGQLELMALAQAYGIDINVLQSEGKPEKITCNDAESRGTIWLAYYRHGFGLGEHYNSLRKPQSATDADG